MKDLNFKVDEAFYYRYRYAALDRRMSLIDVMRASFEVFFAETAEVGRSEETLPGDKNKKKRKKK